jgi:hypothetical protein
MLQLEGGPFAGMIPPVAGGGGPFGGQSHHMGPHSLGAAEGGLTWPGCRPAQLLPCRPADLLLLHPQPAACPNACLPTGPAHLPIACLPACLSACLQLPVFPLAWMGPRGATRCKWLSRDL